MSITRALDTAMALEPLDHWLREAGYGRRERDGIAATVRRTAGLADAVPEYLDPEDEETATGILEESFPPLPGPHPDWQDESVWLDVDSIVEAFERGSQRHDEPDGWPYTSDDDVFGDGETGDGETDDRTEPDETPAPGTEDDRDDRTPDRAWVDPRRAEPEDAEFGERIPPISGGCDTDDALWCVEPSDADWEWLYQQSREYPPSGGLD